MNKLEYVRKINQMRSDAEATAYSNSRAHFGGRDTLLDVAELYRRELAIAVDDAKSEVLSALSEQLDTDDSDIVDVEVTEDGFRLVESIWYSFDDLSCYF